MKRVYIILGGLLFFSSLSAQVGINTESPQQLLHINGNDAGSITDDVVVTEKGTVGIGTVNPNENLKLHVEGTINNYVGDSVKITGNHYVGGNLELGSGGRIGVGTTNPQTPVHIVAGTGEAPLRLKDGSEESSYLLTTNGDGYASWDALRPMSSIVPGTFVNSATLTPPGSGGEGNIVISNQLRLTAGKWLIFARSETTRSSQGLYVYLVLRQYSGSTPSALSRVGAYASVANASQPDLGGIAANQLMYLVDISSATYYDLQLASSTSANFVNSNKNYFYAVRLDRNN